MAVYRQYTLYCVHNIKQKMYAVVIQLKFNGLHATAALLDGEKANG